MFSRQSDVIVLTIGVIIISSVSDITVVTTSLEDFDDASNDVLALMMIGTNVSFGMLTHIGNITQLGLGFRFQRFLMTREHCKKKRISSQDQLLRLPL